MSFFTIKNASDVSRLESWAMTFLHAMVSFGIAAIACLIVAAVQSQAFGMSVDVLVGLFIASSVMFIFSLFAWTSVDVAINHYKERAHPTMFF